MRGCCTPALWWVVFALAVVTKIGQVESEIIQDEDDGHLSESIHDGDAHIDADGDEHSDADDGAPEDGLADEDIHDDPYSAEPEDEEEHHERKPEEDEKRVLDPERMIALYGKIDADNDGKISKADIVAFDKATRMHHVKQALEEQFHHLDLDMDGGLSSGELMPEGGVQEEHMDDIQDKMESVVSRAKFNIADRDGDGKIGRDELMHYMHSDFNAEVLELTVASLLKIRDSDGDGFLNMHELYGAGTDAWQVEELERSGQAVEFKKHDVDGNGKLDAKELEMYETPSLMPHLDIAELFANVDTDGDSFLSHDELLGHLEKLSNDVVDGFQVMIDHVFTDEARAEL